MMMRRRKRGPTKPTNQAPAQPQPSATTKLISDQDILKAERALFDQLASHPDILPDQPSGQVIELKKEPDRGLESQPDLSAAERRLFGDTSAETA